MPFVVRRAQSEDLGPVLSLIAAMFVDLGTTEIPASWHVDAEDALRTRDEVAAFVTVEGGRVVAVAVGLVEQRLPSPRRPDGRVGYVEWLATALSERRRGAARLAMDALMAWYGQQGLKVVDVHASAAASPLYRELGFSESQSTPLRRIM